MSLVLKNVTKNFGGLRAVGDVSFTVPDKSIFGLIGPNGAGKTTVFNLITGVYKHDVGSIHFGKTDLLPLKPSQIAGDELSKKSGLFSGLLRTPTHYSEEKRLTKKAEELLDVFKLKDLKDAPSTSLPYGNQRRLEICRAMMLEPKLLLRDEPAAGMNYGEAEGLKEQIRWLRETFSIAVVLVEHNMQVVMGVCEEIHVLDHGETIAHGVPSEIKAHPKVIAAYLGEETAEAS